MISRSFSAAAIILGCVSVAAPALAGSLAGIAVGEPLSSASEKLRRFGELRTFSGPSGGMYSAGDYIVVGCNGRVWSISRSLSPSFRNFMASAKRIELEQSAVPVVNVTSDDGREELSILELQWSLDDGSNRKLMYAEGRSGTSVSEVVQQATLC